MPRFSIWAAILVLAATLFNPAVVSAQPRDAATLLAGFSAALNAADVELAVGFFAEDGTVGAVTQGGEQFVGRERVRVWAQRLIDGHFHVQLEPTYEGGVDQVTWPTRLWLDQWRDLGVTPAVVIVTVTAKDGFIQTFDSRVDDDSSQRLQAATTVRQTVDGFFSTLNAGDLDGAIALLADDVVVFGALGDRTNGKADARTYYGRLVSQHLQVDMISGWLIDGDRATAVYGLGLDPLRAMGVESAETMGQFYVHEGRITLIQARFTPRTLTAIQATSPNRE